MADIRTNEYPWTTTRPNLTVSREFQLQSPDIEDVNWNHSTREHNSNCGRASKSTFSFLLAKIKALESRCLALENIVLSTHTPSSVQQNIPIANFDTSNPTSAPSLAHSNSNFNVVDDCNAGEFQWTNPTAGHAMNVDIDPSNLQPFPDLLVAGRNVTGVDQSPVDQNLQDWTDLDHSNIPSAPSSLSPSTFETSFEAASTPGGSNTTPGPTVTAANPTNRFYCQYCMKTFARRHDLRRHSRSHDPSAYQFCPAVGCGRLFTRKDKLNDHRARMRH